MIRAEIFPRNFLGIICRINFLIAVKKMEYTMSIAQTARRQRNTMAKRLERLLFPERQKIANRKFYLKNRKKLIARAKIYASKHRNKIKVAVYNRYWENRDRVKADAVRRYRAKRNEVIREYGGRCAVCGCDKKECLVFDHVADDGKADRHWMKKSGKTLLEWAKLHIASGKLQLLCANCNHLKEMKRRRIFAKIENLEYRKKLKKSVMEKLGFVCEICREKNHDLLTVDHIFGGGRKHIGAIGGNGFYREIRNMPNSATARELFRMLCCNCNYSRSRRNNAADKHGILLIDPPEKSGGGSAAKT